MTNTVKVVVLKTLEDMHSYVKDPIEKHPAFAGMWNSVGLEGRINYYLDHPSHRMRCEIAKEVRDVRRRQAPYPIPSKWYKPIMEACDRFETYHTDMNLEE